jgi:hypothetical protein
MSKTLSLSFCLTGIKCKLLYVPEISLPLEGQTLIREQSTKSCKYNHFLRSPSLPLHQNIDTDSI